MEQKKNVYLAKKKKLSICVLGHFFWGVQSAHGDAGYDAYPSARGDSVTCLTKCKYPNNAFLGIGFNQ
jgi:hypothetical protein